MFYSNLPTLLVTFCCMFCRYVMVIGNIAQWLFYKYNNDLIQIGHCGVTNCNTFKVKKNSLMNSLIHIKTEFNFRQNKQSYLCTIGGLTLRIKHMQYQCGKCNTYLSCNSNLKSQIKKHTEETPCQFNQ